MDEKAVKRGLEAILFVWGSPVDPGAAAGVFGFLHPKSFDFLKNSPENMSPAAAADDTADRRKLSDLHPAGMRGSGTEFLYSCETKKLSGAALEALAVIAYRQPVSRVQIDEIRGVKSERAVESLLKRGLVEERGRGSGLGRPILYGRHRCFLKIRHRVSERAAGYR